MNVKYLFTTSIGKKQVVGLTGLGISIFALMHMIGNLLLFVGADTYNKYSHALTSNPALPALEILLLVAAVVHVLFTVQLVAANQRAKGKRAAHWTNGSKRTSWAVRTMILSGLLLLAFLVLHLITFKYGSHYDTVVEGVPMRDLYRLVFEKFQSPTYVVWYTVCLVLLGLHLSHGITSVFQSLGIGSVKSCLLRRLGWGFAIVIAGGFLLQPFYMMFLAGGSL